MTNKSLFVILLLSLLLAGCTPRPKGVLSRKEMISVLVDIHRTEGALQATNRIYGKDEEAASYYQGTLAKHGITQAQFDSSLVWYTDHPKRFNKIYPKVIQILQSELDAYNALHPDVPIEILEEDITIKEDTFEPLVISAQEWEQIVQHGLPVYWKPAEPQPFSIIVNP